MAINWYPGHMVKAQRQMGEQMRHVDAVVELVDARAPWSCLNPNFNKVIRGKPRIFLLTKADLADLMHTSNWKRYLSKHFAPTLVAKSLNAFPWNKIADAIRIVTPKLKGILPKVMVIGVPNVGKSTFINQKAKKKITKVENRPSVTRNLQWIKHQEMHLLDTPGILWPKFSQEKTGFHLALIGSIRPEIVPLQETAEFLIAHLQINYPQMLVHHFRLTSTEVTKDVVNVINAIGKKRGFLLTGGELDFDRTCEHLLYKFRIGDIGRITLETPDNPQKNR